MTRLSMSAPAVALGSLLLLTGFGPAHLHTVRAAKERLIGQDAAVLRSCIGEPMAVRPHPERPARIEVYSSAQARAEDGTLLATPRPDAAAHEKACVFEVIVNDDGRITAVDSDNRAGWGGGSIKACSAVVRRCSRGMTRAVGRQQGRGKRDRYDTDRHEADTQRRHHYHGNRTDRGGSALSAHHHAGRRHPGPVSGPAEGRG